MARGLKDRRLPIGQDDAPPAGPGLPMPIVGGAIVGIWFLAVLIWGFGLGQVSGISGFLFVLFIAALPVAMLAFVLALLRQIADLRDETASLSFTLSSLRKQDQRPSPTTARAEPVPSFASRRDAAQAAEAKPAVVEDQPGLALASVPEPESPPVAVTDLIRALQFPESAEDVEAFAALRRALTDRAAAKLIRAAQDVLTLLAQEGIYMDDLPPDRARPELWRRFASGERGRAVAALGGVRDRSSLALTAQRMREDPVFRDAAHHFLRSFDKAFAAAEQRMSDEEIGDLSDTRTARAFMLVGRVAGTFD